MPLKGPAKTDYQRNLMKMRRAGSGGGSNKAGSNEVGLTEYPAILKALVDPEKRLKLEKIYLSLKDFKQAENVYYGCGRGSVPFDIVGDLLEVTK